MSPKDDRISISMLYPIICNNKECAREFTPTKINQKYCCSYCYQRVNALKRSKNPRGPYRGREESKTLQPKPAKIKPLGKWEDLSLEDKIKSSLFDAGKNIELIIRKPEIKKSAERLTKLQIEQIIYHQNK